MTIPADYNAATLHIVPWDVYNAGQIVQNAAEDIIGALTVIGDTLNKLQLGWVGTSAAEAKSFGDEWTAAMTNLFGSNADPSSGVLNQVIVTLFTAAGNYTASEQAITSMFASMASSLPSPYARTLASDAPAPAEGPGVSVTDGSMSAVGEIGWTSTP
jgi:hypothetical protein